MKKLITLFAVSIAVSTSLMAIISPASVSLTGFDPIGLGEVASDLSDIRTIDFTPIFGTNDAFYGSVQGGLLGPLNAGGFASLAAINYDTNGIFSSTPIDPFVEFDTGVSFTITSGYFDLTDTGGVVNSLTDSHFDGYFTFNGDFAGNGELTFTESGDSSGYTMSLQTVSDESSTVALLGLGLAGLGAIARRRK